MKVIRKVEYFKFDTIEFDAIEFDTVLNKQLPYYLEMLLKALNSKDLKTYIHSKSVFQYAKLIANELSLTYREKTILYYAAYTHDIGKLAISNELLNKKESLNNEEFKIIKKHPVYSYDILSKIKELEHVAMIAKHHHEKYDGTGYPSGLKGNNIPYLSRILTVIDSFDAMTSQRSYNKIKSYETRIQELIENSYSQFDYKIVYAFIRSLKPYYKFNNFQPSKELYSFF